MKQCQFRLSANCMPALDERLAAPSAVQFGMVSHADRTSRYRLFNRCRYTRKEDGFSCASNAAINADVAGVNAL